MKAEVKIGQRALDKSRYMMATIAIHKLGNISSDVPDLCRIYAETDNDWVGSWVTGFGFFDVYFPKATTRSLNEQELAKFKNQHIAISDMDLGTAVPQDYIEDQATYANSANEEMES